MTASLRLIIDLFFLMTNKKTHEGKGLFFLFPWKSKKMKKVYIVTRTRYYSRQVLIVLDIHLPSPVNSTLIFLWGLPLHLHSFMEFSRSDSTFWLWGVALWLSTASFWLYEFRSGHVTQAESISYWVLLWTSVLGLSRWTGVRPSLSIELLGGESADGCLATM